MEKLSNTKVLINTTMVSLKQFFLKEDVTERELKYIESMLKEIAASSVYDAKNQMNEVINAIYK